MHILSAHLQGVIDEHRSSYTVFIGPAHHNGEITQAQLVINNSDMADYNNRFQEESILTDFGSIVFSSYEKAYDHAHLAIFGTSFAFANLQKVAAKFLRDQEQAANDGDNMHLDHLSAQEEKDRKLMEKSKQAYPNI